jgi:hypothetical protein
VTVAEVVFAVLIGAGVVVVVASAIGRVLRKRRLEDSRPVYEHTPSVRLIDRPEFYDQEEDG